MTRLDVSTQSPPCVRVTFLSVWKENLESKSKSALMVNFFTCTKTYQGNRNLVSHCPTRRRDGTNTNVQYGSVKGDQELAAVQNGKIQIYLFIYFYFKGWGVSGEVWVQSSLESSVLEDVNVRHVVRFCATTIPFFLWFFFLKNNNNNKHHHSVIHSVIWHRFYATGTFWCRWVTVGTWKKWILELCRWDAEPLIVVSSSSSSSSSALFSYVSPNKMLSSAKR